MESRVYSQKRDAVWIFSDLLNHVGRRGWFSAGPSSEDGQTLLYVSFHLHPDDADRVFSFLQYAINAYGGTTKWAINRHQNNRFFLCPVEVKKKAEELGNLGTAMKEVRRLYPNLERRAAVDLIQLSDFIYESTRRLYEKKPSGPTSQ